MSSLTLERHSPAKLGRNTVIRSNGKDACSDELKAAYASVAPKQTSQPPRKNSADAARSVFGFFSLKEPSTQALRDYAIGEQRRASASGRPGIVGLSSVSGQKLPAHVPSVNSKWDGLPQAARRPSGSQSSSPRGSRVSFEPFDSSSSVRSKGASSIRSARKLS